jgi:hypothetical protein
VGIEALEDLQADLAAGLERAAAVLPKASANREEKVARAAVC